MKRGWLMMMAVWAVGCIDDGDTTPEDDPDTEQIDMAPAPDMAAEPDMEVEPDVQVEADMAIEADLGLPPEGLEWGECPRGTPRAGQPTCATIAVPLQWDQPDGQTIDVVVMRYGNGADPIGQLWLLDGGPGGSGTSFGEFGLVDLFRPAGYEMFVMSHRGTGFSTPLDCNLGFGDDFVSTLRDCGASLAEQWGDGLAGFRASEAARDLGYAIDAVNVAEGGRISVYGISYGTYWGLRYLQAFPEQADAVILDGVLDLQAEVWLNGAMAEEVGFYLMDLCAEQPGCNGAFDVAPREAVEAAFDNVAAGNCAPLNGFPPEDMASVLGFLIAAAPETRPLVPAFFARAARCNDQDAAELEFFVDAIFENLFGGFRPARLDRPLDWPRRRFQGGDIEFNQALYFAVLMADLLPPWALDPVDVFEASRDLRFNGPPDDPAAMLAAWPDIPLPDDHLDPPDTDIPVLLTQGLLDVQTVPAWARRAGEAFDGPNQNLVIFPYGGHGLIDGVPTVDGGECGMEVMQGFLADPRGPLDTGCLERLVVPDLAGERPETRQVSEIFFGTPELMPGG